MAGRFAGTRAPNQYRGGTIVTDQNLDRGADEEAGDAPVEAGETGASQQKPADHQGLEEHDEADSASDTDV